MKLCWCMYILLQGAKIEIEAIAIVGEVKDECLDSNL